MSTNIGTFPIGTRIRCIKRPEHNSLIVEGDTGTIVDGDEYRGTRNSGYKIIKIDNAKGRKFYIYWKEDGACYVKIALNVWKGKKKPWGRR